MPPLLRNVHLHLESLFTLEQAVNQVIIMDREHGIFQDLETHERAMDDETNQLRRVLLLAERIVAAAWIRTNLSTEDLGLIDQLFQSLELTSGAPTPLLRRRQPYRQQYNDFVEYLDEARVASDLRPNELLGEPGAVSLRFGVEDGIISYLLDPPSTGSRACLWCGLLFRPDRVSALFDSSRCRVAYHRARTADQKQPLNTVIAALHQTPMCAICKRPLRIIDASGLVYTDSRIFIGAANSEHAVCRACAFQTLAEWSDYVTAMTPTISTIAD